MMVYLTRVEHFNAAHRLLNTDWTDEQNQDAFGKCSNPNWHGHNYELHVTVKGEPNPATGFVFNAKKLGTIINDTVIEKIDHKNLNIDVDFMKGKFTTAENLVVGIWHELKPEIEKHGVQLHSLRLYETPRIYVEYFG
jgi:6-pyruvoyltetrahydropterin/6-carboxytetrahydropterin synthase